MIFSKTTCNSFIFLIISLVILQSCEKNTINFGTSQADSYADLVQVDTVGVNMSTFVRDSFITTNASSFLFGRYKDPELGTISAKPFLQLSPPADLSLSNDAVYDSLTFIIKSAKYYYGDTTRSQTIIIKELADPLEYTYGYSFYNTSSIAEYSNILGSKNLLLRPNRDDSFQIRLNDTKGLELFNKVKQLSDQVLNQANFLNYFKGVSISCSNADSAAIYGITDSVCMRLHYHKTTPYHGDFTKDFLWYPGGLYFNQLLSNRSGTTLGNLITGSGDKEIPSAALNNKAYTQGPAGVQLKITLPSLKNIILANPYIAILKATLILRVATGSYDDAKLWLPGSLYLATTGATNIIGASLYSADQQMIKGYPVTDHIYDALPYYSFDITSYINTQLTSSTTTTDNGLFVLENAPGQITSITRGIFNGSGNASTAPQLILTVLNIKN